MSDQHIGRREVLSGLVMAGGAGALVGSGTTALFSDEETFANNNIRASANIAGTVDLEVQVQSLEEAAGVKYVLNLPDGVNNNNPSYVWVRTLKCPDRIGVADDLDVELRLECPENERVVSSGSLTQVLDELREGELLLCFDGDEEQCLQPGGTQTLVLEVVDVGDVQNGALEFELEFYAEQCRYNAGTTTPFDEDDVIDECDPTQAISYIAFCSESGDTLDPEITGINETDGDGDPTSIDWRTTSDVDYVVVKSGENITIYDYRGENVTEGTAISGGDPDADFYGTQPSDRSSAPCELAADVVGDTTFPDDGTSVKLEYEDGEFVREEE